MWETKDSKHVVIFGVGDKRQIIVAMSSHVTRESLHFQVNFTTLTTMRIIPLNGNRR